jgi:hypothetical protein
MPLGPTDAISPAGWLRSGRTESAAAEESREAARASRAQAPSRQPGAEPEASTPPLELSKGRLLDIYG